MTAPNPTLRLLDTDVVIDVQRKHSLAQAWFSTLVPGGVAIPGFVAMELVQSAQNAAQARAADILIAPMPIVWPNAADCQRALAEFRLLHLSHNLGLIDALIAATAIGIGATLCTFNIKHYKAVVGLVLEQPYTR